MPDELIQPPSAASLFEMMEQSRHLKKEAESLMRQSLNLHARIKEIQEAAKTLRLKAPARQIG
jgi:hypothetical protein